MSCVHEVGTISMPYSSGYPINISTWAMTKITIDVLVNLKLSVKNIQTDLKNAKTSADIFLIWTEMDFMVIFRKNAMIEEKCWLKETSFNIHWKKMFTE